MSSLLFKLILLLKLIETAKNMLNKGYEIEEIASLVGLSKEEIEALK